MKKCAGLKATRLNMAAALKSISGAKPWHVHLVWDDGSYEGPVTLVAVGTSPRTGGLFYMTPKALLDDGLLDFVFAPGLSRRQMLTLLSMTMDGSHIDHPLMTYAQTKSLSITSSPPIPIQADGEVIDRDALEINYTIIPQKLRGIV